VVAQGIPQDHGAEMLEHPEGMVLQDVAGFILAASVLEPLRPIQDLPRGQEVRHHRAASRGGRARPWAPSGS
jgi:hypothetical protein